MNTSENKFTEPIICGHCNNKGPMKIVFEYNQIKSYSDDRSSVEWQEGPFYQLSVCPACSGVIFRKYYYHEAFLEDMKWEALFPSKGKIIRSLPPDIEKEYDASEKVRNIDYNAYGAQIRRVLESVCIDKRATGKFLYDKILSLGESKAIPEELREMALLLNKIAKIGAHKELGDITAFEVPLLEALCRNILIYLYEVPAIIRQAESKIEQLKKRKSI